eukprot:2692114-Pyramimonas_sp.AAC.1
MTIGRGGARDGGSALRSRGSRGHQHGGWGGSAPPRTIVTVTRGGIGPGSDRYSPANKGHARHGSCTTRRGERRGEGGRERGQGGGREGG